MYDSYLNELNNNALEEIIYESDDLQAAEILFFRLIKKEPAHAKRIAIKARNLGSKNQAVCRIARNNG